MRKSQYGGTFISSGVAHPARTAKKFLGSRVIPHYAAPLSMRSNVTTHPASVTHAINQVASAHQNSFLSMFWPF